MSDSHKAALAILEDIDRMAKMMTLIDTTDIKEASRQLAEIGAIFDSIPVESNHLKQCAPVIALYKTKLTLVKAGVRKAFSGILDFSKDNYVHVHPAMYDTPSLWMAASKLHIENVILSDLSTILSKRIFSELLKHNQVSFASGETAWGFAPKESSLAVPPAEAIVSVMNFVKSNFFVALGADRVFLEFGRRVWPTLSASLLKQYQLSQSLCDLEAGLVQLALIDTAKISVEYNKSLTTDREKEQFKILTDIRARLLGDVNRKIRKIDKETGPLSQFKFIPNMVSVEVGRLPGLYFKSNRDMIPSIISLFSLLRQTQYVDPKGLNPRMMGIFFNDTVFLTVALAMLKKEGKEEYEIFDMEIAILKMAGQKSTASFLSSVVTRANERLVAFRDQSWDQGLVTKAQFDQADKDLNEALKQILVCVNEWRAIMMDPEIVAVWTTMMIDRFVREMNTLAVNTAKAAITKSTPSGLWQIYTKFLNSVEKIIPAEITDNMTSVKVGRKIKSALSASLADINAITDPMVVDETLFGINIAGFAALIQVNPLLKDESKESKTRMANKFMTPA